MNRFLRSFFLFVVAGLFPLAAVAQKHGNEWINFSQSYLKIPIGQQGIYKISYQDLQKAGFPIASVNPRNLQLFHRGQEQAIFVAGEANNIFDPEDYVLFYGQRNNGSQEHELYISPEAVPNPYYSLYSDTTAYFLTFNLTNQAGKRMPLFSENNTYGLAPEPYYLEERLQLFTTNFSGGIVHPYAGDYKTQLAYGDFGEGFTGDVIANGATSDINFPELGQQVNTAPPPGLELVLVGRNNLAREITLSAGAATTSLSPLHTAAFTGGTYYKVKEALSWDMLSGGQSVIRIATDAGERVSVSYAKLTYARAWDMSGAYEKVFHLAAGSMERRYIEVKNVPSSVMAYDITDPDNIKRIGLKRLDASTVAAVLPDGTLPQKLLFSGIEATLSSVEKVKFRQIDPGMHNYLMVSHRLLRQQAGAYADPVKAYAAYRASAAGGGFDTLLLNMDQLYNQFSYGEINPMAIRRFVTYMAAGGEPAYLFLVGKALDTYYNYHRSTAWTSENRDLVPTFGYPGADIPFTAKLKGSGYAPFFPVGRLGARNPQEVANYLDKVKEMESQPGTDLSRKRLVHLSGGTSASQIEQFRRYLADFESIAEGPYLGGKVETIKKSVEVVVQEIDITKQVNEGVGLVTFFGHSSPNISDMEIGYVSDERTGYRNKGKYPCILVNGCDAGDIFSTAPTITFGEDWIFTADRGALHFIAHSGVGYTNLLRNYSASFYEVAFADTNFIAASTGAIQAETIRRFLQKVGTNEIAMAQAQEMVLQGDPAVKLFGKEKADYEINNNALYVTAYNQSEKVNLSADSIALAIVSRNFGRTYPDSLSVKVNVRLKGSTAGKTFIKNFKSPYYQDTLLFALMSEELMGPGVYHFDVQLNHESVIPETSYTNNTASTEVLLNYGGTINLLPQQYGLLGEGAPELFFQATDLFAKGNGYLLEIDTSAGFKSGLLQQLNLQGDALLKHKLSLPLTNDSVTYFWRTKLAQDDTAWVQSSFSYVPQTTGQGWTQRHTAQFRENRLNGISVQEDRQWTFNDISRRVEVITFGPSAPGTDYTEVEFRLDDVGYILGSIGRYCRNNSINVVHLDRATLDPLIAILDGALDAESCGRIPKIINNFIEKDIIYGNNDDFNLEKFIAEVPLGDYVVLFSIGSVSYEQWPPSVKEQLVTLGADPQKLAALTNGEPYILMGKKGGGPEQATEVYAVRGAGNPPLTEQSIQLDRTLEGKMQRATIATELIGPAREWKELAYGLNTDAPDVFELQLVGVNAQMEEQLLFKSSEEGSFPLSIDAAQFPYLKLQLKVEDGENLSPPQLRYWQLFFEPLPEGVLLPGDSLQLANTFEEGEQFHPGFRFINISKQAFADSLQLVYTTFNKDQGSTQEEKKRIMAPAAADTTYFNIAINTDKRPGRNDLKVQVNPQLLPEMIYSNNILDANNFYTVRKDTLQPLIDIAFDGLYITNGAIVSPQPLISILLRDENKFKKIQDTTDLQIYLKKDCENCQFERVNLLNANARWYPASEKEDFRLEFEPGKLADGLYTLQVQAADASGNKAGKEPFSISFNVINESSITKFYPYPNPFSTATRFVFTLTGSQVPDDIKIQIMTVDGRVVREILKEELGPIRIGNNITDFAWNGRDQWGDQLANGVYLYKVYIRHSGDSFENRETKGDKAFKEGFGKLYLLR